MRTLLFLFCCNLINGGLLAQDQRPEIRFELTEAPGDTALLVFRKGEGVRMQDTVLLSSGKGSYQPTEAIPAGTYLLIFPPKNNGFEFLIGRADQRQTLRGSLVNPDRPVLSDSPNNLLFDAYKIGMSRRIGQRNALQTERETATANRQAVIDEQLTALGEGVRAYQDSLVSLHPELFAARLIASFQEPVIPDPPVLADGSIDSLFRYRYYRDHFLDGVDFTEEGFLRTQYFQPALDRYLDQLLPQQPDSLTQAIDDLLARARPNPLVFRYLLGNLIDKYRQPKLIGQDAVFVHLADNYLRKGDADDWIKPDIKKRLLDDAYMLRNVLIGNAAPKVETMVYDTATGEFGERTMSPYDVTAKHTVVFLWKPGCGACKKMTEALKPVYAKYGRDELEIFSISSATYKDLEKAKKDIVEKEMPWIITADPYLRARAMQQYYGTSLPKLYVLDENKEIIYSRVNAEQLDQIIEMRLKEAAAN